MKTIFFTKKGGLYLVDRFTKKKEKVPSFIHYLDCPAAIEKGTLFGTFFNHVVKEKDFLNIVFKETMGNTTLDPFIEEWNKPAVPFNKEKGIQYIKGYKIFDYIELPEQESFVDIRIDFDGVGVNEELYNLEFIPINELKNIPLCYRIKYPYIVVSPILKEKNYFLMVNHLPPYLNWLELFCMY